MKSGLPFHAFRCCWKFSTETISNVVFQIFSNRIFRKRFVITGKQQLPTWSSVETNSRLFYSCIAPLHHSRYFPNQSEVSSKPHVAWYPLFVFCSDVIGLAHVFVCFYCNRWFYTCALSVLDFEGTRG